MPIGIEKAVQLFEQKKRDYDKWYMERERVSIVMISQRDRFIERCDWAIETLKESVSK